MTSSFMESVFYQDGYSDGLHYERYSPPCETQGMARQAEYHKGYQAGEKARDAFERDGTIPEGY